MKHKPWRIEDLSEAGLEKLAAWLSLILNRGDVLHLEGDLGAGKTTFARALIRQLSGNQMDEIPSPTFSLVQHYETPRVQIYHFDLYRLSHADEVHELGMDDALVNGVSLIEWPDRLGAPLTPDYLQIHFEETTKTDERHLTLTGHGLWIERISRLADMVRFVEKSDWGASHPCYMQGDASARAYARLGQSPQRAILMNAPAQSDGPLVRQLVDEAEDLDLDQDIFIGHHDRPYEVVNRSMVHVCLEELDNAPNQSTLEGMASGCALVATDVGLTSRTVTPDVGVLVRPDEAEIADQVSRKLANPEAAQKLGAAGRAKVLREFYTEDYLEYLQKLHDFSTPGPIVRGKRVHAAESSSSASI